MHSTLVHAAGSDKPFALVRTTATRLTDTKTIKVVVVRQLFAISDISGRKYAHAEFTIDIPLFNVAVWIARVVNIPSNSALGVPIYHFRRAKR
jgi:hypothetical protein